MEVEQRTLKRKLDEAREDAFQEKQLREENAKKARGEQQHRLKMASCLHAADQEMCSRRAERDQVIQENEHLKGALATLKANEAGRLEQLRQLQNQIRLMEEEQLRMKASNDLLTVRRRQSLQELAEAQAQTEEVRIRSRAVTKELQDALEEWRQRCIESEERARIAITDALSSRRRFSQLAQLANQAIEEIPRRLSAAESRTDPLRTPREIAEFLDVCRDLCNVIKNLPASRS